MQRNLPGRLALAAVFAAIFLACDTGIAQDLKSFEQRITTKVLPNGLTIIICETTGSAGLQLHHVCGCRRCKRSRRVRAAWLTCLSISPSRAQARLAPRTTRQEKVALDKVEAANNAYEAEYLKPDGPRPEESWRS